MPLLEEGNRLTRRVFNAMLVARIFGLAAFLVWLRWITPLHGLQPEHIGMLTKHLWVLCFFVAAMYGVVTVATHVTILVAGARSTNGGQFNKFVFSVLQVAMFFLLIVDVFASHEIKRATGGAASAFRVVDFILVAMAMLALASGVVATAFTAIVATSYAFLYFKFTSVEANLQDFGIGLSLYLVLWAFLAYMRWELKVGRRIEQANIVTNEEP